MLFGNSASTTGDVDESMSVDGTERTRDGSVLVSFIITGRADGSRIGLCVIGGRRNLDLRVRTEPARWLPALVCHQSGRAS